LTLSLYIYWKVAPALLADALAAVRSFQGSLEIEAHVLRRAQLGDTVTLMETYTGLSAPACRRLIEASAAALGRWALEGRHAEVFEPA